LINRKHCRKRLAIAAVAISVAFLAPDSLGGKKDCQQIERLRGGKDMSMNDTSQPAPTRAIRLIFEYEGDQVHLVSQQPVEMAITGFDIARTEHPGYYVDTRDAAGRTLARVPARNAFSGSTEVFPEKPGEPITRVDVAKPRGAFTVVIPAPGDADHVSLVQVTPRKPDAVAPAGRATSLVEGGAQVVELARFPLKSNTEGGGQP
jgi:hypothetical protein